MPMRCFFRITIAVALEGLLMQAFRTLGRPVSQLCTPSTVARARAGTRKMHIQSIPMWESTGKNYAYIVSDEETKDFTVIDPANPPEVLPHLKQKTEGDGMKMQSIINTHHHYDHVGGNAEILKHHPHPILGGAQCAHVTTIPAHNSTLSLSPTSTITLTALHTPCHTQDSICWAFHDSRTDERVVFTGDTLFTGGCGRFFEGTADEMNAALNDILARLEDRTTVYPGHEYTAANVAFAASILPDDAAVKALLEFTKQNKRTEGRFTIGDEKRHNVFMRVGDPVVEKVAGVKGDVEVMGRLREMKNAS